MKFIHPSSQSPVKSKPVLDKTEKVMLSIIFGAIALLGIFAVNLANQPQPLKEFVCMQNIQYEIKNKVELHIILHKNQVVTCEEFKFEMRPK